MELRPSFLNRQPPLIKVLLAASCLYLFLVGIGGMGGAFKLMGKAGAMSLIESHGPFISLCIGILATTLVQSSSTTTSTVVALVASGALELDSGIYMVMGANVGTTVTNTIVSLGHITHGEEYRRAFAAATVHDFFNIIVLIILFPLELYTGALTLMADWSVEQFESVGGGKLASPLKVITGPAISGLKSLCFSNGIALLVVSLVMMFSTLIGLVKCLKSLTMHRISDLFDGVIFKTPLRSLGFGLLLTILVQSSSVSTSVAVPMVGAGLLTIRQVFPYTMGANIGTTCTALIAALGAMAAASSGTDAERAAALLGLTVAFHHVYFNVVGVLVVWCFREIPIWIAESFAELALRNRLIPVFYIVITFYLLPAAVWWFGT